ncbi:MAG: helix-turn-helix transcriptional regulator [Dehalococcoidia bacterium]|nr:helix-turn-helix transcriptional regulator [Dehalococcoidia bacterium]
MIGDNTQEQAALFSALGDPTRLRLVKLLCRQHDPDALCVNALAGILGVTQSAVSQHLRVLKSAGLVNGERRGYHMHYYVNRDALDRFFKETRDSLSRVHDSRASGNDTLLHRHRDINHCHTLGSSGKDPGKTDVLPGYGGGP